MQIVAISGKAQHGKDTTAALMGDALETLGYKVLTVHYADLLKFICKVFFSWDGIKDAKGRDMLQRVGTDVIRAQDPDYWVGFIAGVLGFFPSEWDYVLIPDARFPNEIEVLRSAGFSVSHLRVIRPHYRSPLTSGQLDHPSETSMDAVTPDYVIYNDGSVAALKTAVEFYIKEKLHAE